MQLKKILLIGLVILMLAAFSGTANYRGRYINYWTLRITLGNLNSLNASTKKLNLNQKYERNWILQRDEGSLLASSWTSNSGAETDITVPIVERNGRNETKLWCDLFSNYFLRKGLIDTLTGLPGFNHLRLIPEQYGPNGSYICYRITANKLNGDTLALPSTIPNSSRRINPCPPAVP